MQTIGQRIRYYRRLRSIPLKRFATMLGMADSNYQKYEKNERTPKRSRIESIAAILDISVDSLTIGDETMFCSLLFNYMQRPSMCEFERFTDFFGDAQGHVLDVITEVFESWESWIKVQNIDFYGRYLTAPNFATLKELAITYRKSLFTDDDSLPYNFSDLDFPVYSLYKLAFSISMTKYLQTHDRDEIYEDVRAHWNLTEEIIAEYVNPDDAAFSYFADKTFYLYLSIISDPVEFLGNKSDMSDFHNYFVYQTVSAPESREYDPYPLLHESEGEG